MNPILLLVKIRGASVVSKSDISTRFFRLLFKTRKLYVCLPFTNLAFSEVDIVIIVDCILYHVGVQLACGAPRIHVLQ